ncbi:hypothetical protein CPB84DRAFT_1338851 [Gymnopilus junonius]|uniref:Uncharacterized protein n=1 Tax=Gymnopilus junonius TaxID=109634 RepID=A0A9P5NJC4_GYMJU|nr:hypothetical protein CPB84DRAFT_1338851 [Gymnopilus junonius]
MKVGQYLKQLKIFLFWCRFLRSSLTAFDERASSPVLKFVSKDAYTHLPPQKTKCSSPILSCGPQTISHCGEIVHFLRVPACSVPGAFPCILASRRKTSSQFIDNSGLTLDGPPTFTAYTERSSDRGIYDFTLTFSCSFFEQKPYGRHLLFSSRITLPNSCLLESVVCLSVLAHIPPCSKLEIPRTPKSTETLFRHSQRDSHPGASMDSVFSLTVLSSANARTAFLVWTLLRTALSLLISFFASTCGLGYCFSHTHM